MCVQTQLLALLAQSEGTSDGGQSLPRLIATTRRELSPATGSGVPGDAQDARAILANMAKTLSLFMERSKWPRLNEADENASRRRVSSCCP